MKRKQPIKRTTPLPRSTTPIKRSAVLPKHRKAGKKAREFARCYLSTAYVKFCQRQPCAACGRGPCDAAHGQGGGMGYKAGWETLMPLCSGLNGCHARQHRMGWMTGLGMTEEGRRRAAANLRLAWADYLLSGESEL